MPLSLTDTKNDFWLEVPVKHMWIMMMS